MTYRGIARGNAIELDEPLPFAEGQAVRVDVEAVSPAPERGSIAALLQAIREGPHLSDGDVDALLEQIELGKQPVNYQGVFDDVHE